jgi:hypothetical protein
LDLLSLADTVSIARIYCHAAASFCYAEGVEKRRFQIKLDGMGAAIYDAVDAADALRSFFVDFARDGSAETFELTSSDADHATAKANGNELEAVLVSDPVTAEP